MVRRRRHHPLHSQARRHPHLRFRRSLKPFRCGGSGRRCQIPATTLGSSSASPSYDKTASFGPRSTRSSIPTPSTERRRSDEPPTIPRSSSLSAPAKRPHRRVAGTTRKCRSVRARASPALDYRAHVMARCRRSGSPVTGRRTEPRPDVVGAVWAASISNASKIRSRARAGDGLSHCAFFGCVPHGRQFWDTRDLRAGSTRTAR